MKNKKLNALFRALREEAKKINAWEALELIQQAQTAFDCAYFSYGKTYTKQLKKIDSCVAKIRNVLPESDSTKYLESERRSFQSAKDSDVDDTSSLSSYVDPASCWCSEDD